MALPTSYLTSVRNVELILNSIVTGQAPPAFTINFLGQLGFKSSTDRLFIGVLKALSFLDEGGKPTKRYFNYLDQSKSKIVLAEAIRETYSDLFLINKKANDMPQTDLRNKMKTLTEGKLSEKVLEFMARTFHHLCKNADFTSTVDIKSTLPKIKGKEIENDSSDGSGLVTETGKQIDPNPMNIDSLVYNIQLILPESRDQEVYDALFKSLKEHLK